MDITIPQIELMESEHNMRVGVRYTSGDLYYHRLEKHSLVMVGGGLLTEDLRSGA